MAKKCIEVLRPVALCMDRKARFTVAETQASAFPNKWTKFFEHEKSVESHNHEIAEGPVFTNVWARYQGVEFYFSFVFCGWSIKVHKNIVRKLIR